MRPSLIAALAALALLTTLVLGQTQLIAPKSPVPAGKPLASSGPVHIARWKSDRKAALSLTFDDGLVDQLTYALPALKDSGLKATFGLIPGILYPTKADAEEGARKRPPQNFQSRDASWEEWAPVVAEGHEIANHSMTHPWLNKADAATLTREITDAQTLLADKLKLKPHPITFIVPFNAPTPQVSAVTLKTHLFITGADRVTYGDKHNAAWHNKIVDNTLAKGVWTVAMIHAVMQGYSPFATPEDFTKHIDYLKSKQDVLWVNTYAAVGKYKAEAESAKLSVQATRGKITLTLTSDLDPALYDQPLTLIIDTPAKPTSATAKRGATTLPVTLTEKSLLLDAIPGKDPITLEYH